MPAPAGPGRARIGTTGKIGADRRGSPEIHGIATTIELRDQ